MPPSQDVSYWRRLHCSHSIKNPQSAPCLPMCPPMPAVGLSTSFHACFPTSLSLFSSSPSFGHRISKPFSQSCSQPYPTSQGIQALCVQSHQSKQMVTLFHTRVWVLDFAATVCPLRSSHLHWDNLLRPKGHRILRRTQEWTHVALSPLITALRWPPDMLELLVWGPYFENHWTETFLLDTNKRIEREYHLGGSKDDVVGCVKGGFSVASDDIGGDLRIGDEAGQMDLRISQRRLLPSGSPGGWATFWQDYFSGQRGCHWALISRFSLGLVTPFLFCVSLSGALGFSWLAGSWVLHTLLKSHYINYWIITRGFWKDTSKHLLQLLRQVWKSIWAECPV